jgi:hypothetical protein
MNGKKAKAIRRAMRKELEQGSGYKMLFHPSVFTNMMGQKCLRYRVQYLSTGGKQMTNLGKKIYGISGILPRED